MCNYLMTESMILQTLTAIESPIDFKTPTPLDVSRVGYSSLISPELLWETSRLQNVVTNGIIPSTMYNNKLFSGTLMCPSVIMGSLMPLLFFIHS